MVSRVVLEIGRSKNLYYTSAITDKPKIESIPAIFITEATLEDVPGILNVQKEAIIKAFVGDEYGITTEMIEADYTAEKISKIKEYFQTSQYFVAKINNQIVGVVLAGDYGEIKDSVEIKTMWILPEYQSRGIGSKLLLKALDYLKDRDEILLSTGYQQDERAIRFYEKYGFVKTGKTTTLRLYPGQTKGIEEIEFKRSKKDNFNSPT